MQVFALLIVCITIATVIGANDDESWIWNNDNKQKTSRADDGSFDIYEPSENPDNDGGRLGFGPQNSGPFGPNSRPLAPGYQGNKDILVGPGGPTGIIGRPPYLNGGNEQEHGIPNSVPSWIRNDPRYRDYDVCKCAYSFNCPSPSLKFGHCSRDKKYCCYNSRRFPELTDGHHHSFYPDSPHKFRPVDFTSNYYDHRRPPYGNPYGNYQHPSFGGGYYPGNYGRRNEYEPLRPYDYDFDDYEIYGRSLGKNQTEINKTNVEIN